MAEKEQTLLELIEEYGDESFAEGQGGWSTDASSILQQIVFRLKELGIE
jgi:hypothetical protein